MTPFPAVSSLKYVVHHYPEKNTYMFRLYDSEYLERDYHNPDLKHKVSVENNTIIICIEDNHYRIENVEPALIEEFKKQHITWGFSFLDEFHAVISGFYVKRAKDLKE